MRRKSFSDYKQAKVVIKNPTSRLSAKDKERVAHGQRWFGRADDTEKGEPVFFNVVTDEHFTLTQEIQERLGVVDVDDETEAILFIDRQDPATKNNFTLMSIEIVVRIARLPEMAVPGALEYFMLKATSQRAGTSAGVGSPEHKHATTAWERFRATGGSEAAAIGGVKAAIEHFKTSFPHAAHNWDTTTEPALSPKERAKAEKEMRAKNAAAGR